MASGPRKRMEWDWTSYSSFLISSDDPEEWREEEWGWTYLTRIEADERHIIRELLLKSDIVILEDTQ
jgi:hypothetical protein